MSRESWFDAGFERLAAHGPQGLRIMAIAKDMGVTKGSFYWHFKDLREYRTALLAEWERRFTEDNIVQVDRAGGDIAARWRRLYSISEAKSDRRLIFALRTWALDDPLVAKAIARVDERRIGYLTGMLREFGWEEKDAGRLARFVYEGFIGRLILTDVPLSAAQHGFLFRLLTPR